MFQSLQHSYTIMLSNFSIKSRFDCWSLRTDAENENVFHHMRASVHRRRLKKTISYPMLYREHCTDDHNATSWHESPPEYGSKIKRRTILNRLRESLRRRYAKSTTPYPILRISEHQTDDDASSWLGPPPGYEEIERPERNTYGRFRQSIA